MQYDDFSLTTSGTLQVFYDGINIDSTTEPSVRFNSITTGQNNISSAAPTWNAVRVKSTR